MLRRSKLETQEKSRGAKSIKTDHYVCFLFDNPLQSHQWKTSQVLRRYQNGLGMEMIPMIHI